MLIESSVEKKIARFRTSSPFMSGMATMRDLFVEETGRLTVYATVFIPMARSLKLSDSESVEIYTDEHGILHMKSGNIRYRAGTIGANLFPMRDSKKPDNVVTLKCEEFRSMVRRVVYATNLEYPCVQAEMAGNRMTLACTDTARLSVDSIGIDSDIEEAVMVKADAMGMMARLANGTDGEMKFAWCNDQVMCRFDDFIYRIPRVSTTFPKWRGIINIANNHSKTSIVEVAEFRRIVTAAQLFQTPLIMRFASDGIHIEAESEMIGKGQWIVPSEHDGPEATIKLSHQYLYDFLAPLSTGNITVKMQDTEKPVLFTASDYKDLKYLMMPIRKV